MAAQQSPTLFVKVRVLGGMHSSSSSYGTGEAFGRMGEWLKPPAC
jgi:hypothetical protein